MSKSYDKALKNELNIYFKKVFLNNIKRVKNLEKRSQIMVYLKGKIKK